MIFLLFLLGSVVLPFAMTYLALWCFGLALRPGRHSSWLGWAGLMVLVLGIASIIAVRSEWAAQVGDVGLDARFLSFGCVLVCAAAGGVFAYLRSPSWSS